MKLHEQLKILYEYDGGFFSYDNMSKDMWRDKVHEAKKQFKILFDLENDYTVKKQRKITIPQSYWEHIDCTFKCELFSAGGDWEEPVYYFRCQIVKGYALDVATYRNSHFVYIPGKKEGNYHLLPSGSKNYQWAAPNNDTYHKGIDPERNERDCWKALEMYLKDLVEKEIDKIEMERALRSSPEEGDSND